MTILSVLDQSPVRKGGTAVDAINETRELARFTEKLGFHRYWLAEHHASEGLAGSAPEILIAQIAAETNHIRVGSAGVMMTHYSPLKVAETFRMLETLNPGRIDLGVGRAPGSDYNTMQAMGYVRAPISAEYYPNQISDLRDWMAGGLKGEHPFKDVWVQPRGETSPPIWMLGSSDGSARIAAQLGAAFSFAHFITEGGEGVMDHYRRNFQPSEYQASPLGNIGVFVICADTEEEAKRLATSRDLWRVRLDEGQITPIPPIEEAENWPLTPLQRSRSAHHRRRNIIGAPEQVKAQLDELLGRYGVDEAVVITITYDFEARKRSYELLAEVYGLQAQTEA